MATHIGPDNRSGEIDLNKVQSTLPEEAEVPRDRYVMIFHNDADGWGSCGLALNALVDPKRDYFTKAVQYGDDFSNLVEELRPTDHVFVMDFSFERELMDAIYAKVEKFVVIDHHKSAEKHLKDAPYAHFDTSMSGVLLTYMYFFGHSLKGKHPMGEGFEYVPIPVRLLDNYDMWYTEDKKVSWEIVKGFHLYVKDFYGNYEFWRELMSKEDLPPQIFDFIKMKNAEFLNTVTELKESANFTFETHKGVKFIIYPCSDSHYISLMAHDLRKQNPEQQFIGTYFVVEGKLVVSLRGTDSFNVRHIAESHGGGGHDKAAGLSKPHDENCDLHQTVVDMLKAGIDTDPQIKIVA